MSLFVIFLNETWELIVIQHRWRQSGTDAKLTSPPKPLHPKLLYFQQFNVDLTANKNNKHGLFQENKNLKCS